MLGPLQHSVQSFFRFLAGFVGKAVAGAVAIALLLFGFYAMILIAWLLFLMIASLFGYEGQSAQRERQEMYAFFAAHRDAFCRTERIPFAYCEDAFSDSAAHAEAIRAWVQIQLARDKAQQDNAPLWGLLEPFRDPLVKR